MVFPTCGRRFVMQWPPKYKRMFSTAADEYAAHSGRPKAAVKMGGVQIQPSEESAPSAEKKICRLITGSRGWM